MKVNIWRKIPKNLKKYSNHTRLIKCPIVQTLLSSAETVVCLLPPGTGGDRDAKSIFAYNFALEVGSLKSDQQVVRDANPKAVYTFSYSPPVISSILPNRNAAKSGNQQLVISGAVLNVPFPELSNDVYCRCKLRPRV